MHPLSGEGDTPGRIIEEAAWVPVATFLRLHSSAKGDAFIQRVLSAKSLLFWCTLAVGQFRDVAPFTEPSVPGPLLIALSLPWWERRLEVLGALVPQYHFPVSSCG